MAALGFTGLSLQANEQSQSADRFGRAVEELGSQELEVRLGGIYALGQLAHDSHQDEPTITNVLAAYVRIRAPATGACTPNSSDRSGAKNHSWPTDIAAAVTVLVRRGPGATPADLSHACLIQANLTGATLAKLVGANLYGANLAGVDLAGVDLTGVDLTDADLTGVTGYHPDVKRPVR